MGACVSVRLCVCASRLAEKRGRCACACVGDTVREHTYAQGEEPRCTRTHAVFSLSRTSPRSIEPQSLAEMLGVALRHRIFHFISSGVNGGHDEQLRPAPSPRRSRPDDRRPGDGGTRLHSPVGAQYYGGRQGPNTLHLPHAP